MVSEDQMKRQNGVYYTPNELAKHLIEPLTGILRPTSILDPACGSGSLLFAAKEAFFHKDYKQKPNIYGCDVSPGYDKLRLVKPKQVWQSDFLELKLSQRFDLVVMNPPYVRHHCIPRKIKESYNIAVQPICPLPKVADLWAYFLVKAVELVSDGGTLAAILPWSFLQADYARALRAWLGDRFASIEVTAVSSQQFEDAKERIVLVWLRTKGRSAQSIVVRNVTDPTQKSSPLSLSWSEWLRSKVVTTNVGPVDDILSLLSTSGFVAFRDLADTKIGTVTGADSFFIAEKNFATELGLRKCDYQPVVRSLKDLGGLRLNGNCPDQVLMHFPEGRHPPKITQYIKLGRTKDFHLRAHCVRRHLWYMIPKTIPPDAFFPYRASHTPYLVINTPGYLCTNSIHAITWKQLTKQQIEWVQISLLSAPGQLSLEAYAKTYGSGLFKIEPSALGSALVTTGTKRLPAKIYNTINTLLKNNNRDSATSIATDAIMEYCKIDPETVNLCTSVLQELRARRRSSTCKSLL